jgi:hypothetical protein
MADTDNLGYNGLETIDNNTIVENLVKSFNDIYSQNGDPLNLEPNTPDRQLIEVLAYMGTVVRELITEVYNSCDPDKCVGAVQDNRYQINYLTRKQGSYTLQDISVTVNKTVTLQGLEGSYDDENVSAYTVSDDNGNIWYLINTITLLQGTTTRLAFRAKEKGEVIPVIGTITNPVTIIPGVVSVNNNVGATAIGTEEESDSDFRIRRASSVYKSSKNCADTIKTELLEIDDVINVNVHENNTNTQDTTGTPPHYIWVIVEGGDPEKIAEIIYANLAGSGTKGSKSQIITSASMQNITINYDNPTTVPLYIKFDIKATGDPGEIYTTGIKEYIAYNLKYDIGENAETSKIVNVCSDAMISDGGNGYALDIQISLGGNITKITVSGTGITTATANVEEFQHMVQDTSGSYVFSYDGTNWELNSDIVDISKYGISIPDDETPASGDTITITYTAGTWSDYIAVSSIADLFITDETKIYTTII